MVRARPHGISHVPPPGKLDVRVPFGHVRKKEKKTEHKKKTRKGKGKKKDDKEEDREEGKEEDEEETQLRWEDS